MNKDFEKYRLPWEHEEHWKLRKKFLICHQNSFSEDQLICLSQVYMNIKVLGCRYSKEVMQKYVELSKILENFDYQEEQHPLPIDTQGEHEIDEDDTESSVPEKCKIFKSEEEISQLFKDLSQIIIKIQKKEKNPIQVLNMSVMKSHIRTNCLFNKKKKSFRCWLFIDEHLITDAYGSKKQEAIRQAYIKAIEIICRNSVIPKPFENVKKNRHGSVRKRRRKARKIVAARKQNETLVVHNLNSNIHNIVILDEFYIDPSRTSFQVMMRTASFNNVSIVFKYSNINAITISCDLIFNKSLLAQGTGTTKQMARNRAADIALENLKREAYTVMIKKNTESEQIVSREKLQKCALGNAIAESNVGYKLLQKMGWDNNNSLDSAVYARNNESYKRQGLGFSETGEVTKEFISQLEKVIANYASSDTDADLVFSSEFTKEERKEIHRIAQTYSLKSTSKGGKGPDRHSVLSRRFKPVQLLCYLIRCGGQTDKYELLKPGNDS
ncbi:NF-kappa-B-repressing factor [Centruroides vittatus]|uniref:NF-kappa-B-repressing factor n=1 Tax=Centruroides vittatus TaxID=120091 RepID=UPI0035101F74